MRYESAKKPQSCPACGSKRIAEILYGMPVYSSKLQKEEKEGKIVIGGCCITDDDPTWQCQKCSIDIYRNNRI